MKTNDEAKLTSKEEGQLTKMYFEAKGGTPELVGFFTDPSVAGLATMGFEVLFDFNRRLAPVLAKISRGDDAAIELSAALLQCGDHTINMVAKHLREDGRQILSPPEVDPPTITEAPDTYRHYCHDARFRSPDVSFACGIGSDCNKERTSNWEAVTCPICLNRIVSDLKNGSGPMMQLLKNGLLAEFIKTIPRDGLNSRAKAALTRAKRFAESSQDLPLVELIISRAQGRKHPFEAQLLKTEYIGKKTLNLIYKHLDKRLEEFKEADANLLAKLEMKHGTL